MWVRRDGGAAARDADTNGVLPHGIRPVQAEPCKLQPSQPFEPVLHIAGAPLAREHGCEAEADQDAGQSQSVGTYMEEEKVGGVRGFRLTRRSAILMVCLP